nr:DNA/RNA non-specific endonuclease [Flavobacterium agrisoli]
MEHDFEYGPTSTTHQIIKHDFYTLSYHEKYEQAEWVAYFLKKDYKASNSFKRPYFIQDPKVKTNSADWRNYKNSGYDKGHLCPAADMAFNQNAYNDTFYTSNIAPQNHAFNSGIWNRLEQKTRYWSTQYGGLYVVTGGILKETTSFIGEEKVAVPNAFYKILFRFSNGKYKMIAFVIPNKKSDRPLSEYVVSVDSVEKSTGIDFFHKMNDKLENELESQSNYANWIKE